MPRIFSIALSAALVAVVLKAQDAPARDKYSKDQQEVLDVHRSIQEATLRSDVAALDRLWSADVMFIGGDGRVWNKTQRLKDFRSRHRVPSSLAQPDDLASEFTGT